MFTRTPVFAIALAVSLVAGASLTAQAYEPCQVWDNAFGGDAFNSPIECLAVYQGELYAGGRFYTVHGQPAAGIAKWDGVSQSWAALPSELAVLSEPNQHVAVLLGLDTDPVHVALADMNADGTADGEDIQPFVNAVLGITPPPPITSPTAYQTADDSATAGVDLHALCRIHSPTVLGRAVARGRRPHRGVTPGLESVGAWGRGWSYLVEIALVAVP